MLRTSWIPAAAIAALACLTASRATPGQDSPGGLFIRGDANIDGQRDITDAIYMLGCSFLGGECSSCSDAADANDDGDENISDPIYLLNFLFGGGPSPPLPDGACGPDPTADAIGCAAFAPCASNPDAVPTSRGDLIVVPIDHASLALRWDGKAIYSDPVGGGGKYSGLPRPDVIVVTHTHGDHMDAATLRAVAVQGTVLIVPQSVATALAGAGGVPAAEIRVLANGQKTTAGDIGVEAVAMYNITQGRTQYHSKGQGNSYVVDLAGTRVFISGDTEDVPEMRQLTDIGLAFLCMNLPYTMTPQQAASATLEFKPRIVYPYHYRGQNTDTFRSLVEAGSEDIEVRLRNWYPGG